MELPQLPEFVSKIVAELADEGAKSVWLIGSRANGCARDDSDWDLLTFSNREPEERPRRDKNVDVVIFGPSGTGLLEGKSSYFQLELGHWEWRQDRTDARKAKYISKKLSDYDRKLRDLDEPVYIENECRAFRIWPE